MNFFIAYIRGWGLSFRKIKMWLLLYLLNLIFAVVLTLPFSGFLGERMGNSMAFEDLLSGFDHTVYTDFMNEYGDVFSQAMDQSRAVFLLYFIFAVFLVGGILQVFKNHGEKFSYRAFWSGCTYYFWRMLRLSLYFLIVHFAVIGVFIGLIMVRFQNGLEDVSSETVMINAVKYTLPVYLLIASYFFMVQDYAKIHVVHQDPGFLFFPFWQSFAIATKNFFRTYPLYLLNILGFAVFFIAYWYYNFSNEINTGSLILLTLLIGQAFIFARIGTKLINLGSATLMYQSLMPEPEIVMETSAEARPAMVIPPLDMTSEEE